MFQLVWCSLCIPVLNYSRWGAGCGVCMCVHGRECIRVCAYDCVGVSLYMCTCVCVCMYLGEPYDSRTQAHLKCVRNIIHKCTFIHTYTHKHYIYRLILQREKEREGEREKESDTKREKEKAQGRANETEKETLAATRFSNASTC